MVDLEILKDHGLTDELLRKKFQLEFITKTPVEGTPVKELTGDEKILKLRNRMRHRIQAGRNDNISQHRLYHALDLAWDLPFRQISPTLLQSLIDKSPSNEEVTDKLKAWGFDPAALVSEAEDPKTPGKKIKTLNIPLFCEVFVPLVRAYGTIRLAKIMNDRLQVPMLKFDPAINSTRNRLQCDVITNRIEMMNRHYNYWVVMKQSVFQMLHYSVCLQFPVEEWHREEQLAIDDEVPVEKLTRTKEGLDKMMDATGGLLSGGADETANPMEGEPAAAAPDTVKTEPVGQAAVDAAMQEINEPEPPRKLKTKKVVVKEGLRYHMPHPSRMFWDQAHRISTFNTDTGCQFAGYWRVFRYRDIRENPDFWNTDKVNIGDTGWWTASGTFWNTMFSGCTIKPPQNVTQELQASAGKDRETQMVTSFYTQDYDDASVVVSEYFEKLVPKDYGLGTYEYPVWFRFVVAGDDTVLYAAPLPFSPVVAYIYDADEARSQNASLSLEILPFQDQISNLLTQSILTAKANLANVTFVDSNVVGEDWISKMKNWGERLFRVRNFIPFDGRKTMKNQQGVPSAFFSHHFPTMDTAGIIQCIRLVLDMLERVLVMSSQEVAQAASHELREKEVVNIQSSTSTRLQFTATNVDHAAEAMKNQLYEGLMAYGEEDMHSEVPNDPMVTPAILEKLGFTFVDNDEELPRFARKRIQVKHRKTAIALASFTTSRNANTPTDKDSILQLANAFNGWLGNPILGPAIGPDQAIDIANQIARLAGFPKEFKLENANGNPQLEALLKKFMGEVEQRIHQQIQAGLKPMMDLDLQQQQQIQQMQQMLQIPPQPPAPGQYDSTQPPAPDGAPDQSAPVAPQGFAG